MMFMRILQKKFDKICRECGYVPTALVTGASSGIGKVYAETLASLGCNLIIVSNQQKELDDVADIIREKYNVEVLSLFQDLALDTAADDVFSFVTLMK